MSNFYYEDIFQVYKTRPENFAKYIIENNSTIRQTAERFKYSKSLVHKDISYKLKNINPELFLEVKKVLDVNFKNRHFRGGQKTKEKYLKINKFKLEEKIWMQERIKFLEKKVYIDALTGIYNRHFYYDELVPRSDEKEYYLALVDINELKKINDMQGHKAGDDVIIKVANFLKGFGTVVRLGGDEFLLKFDKEVSVNFLHNEHIEFSCATIKKVIGMKIEDALILLDKRLYIEKEKRKNV